MKKKITSRTTGNDQVGTYQVSWGRERVTFQISRKDGVVLQIYTRGGFFDSYYELRPGGMVLIAPQVLVTYDMYTLTVSIESPAHSMVTQT